MNIEDHIDLDRRFRDLTKDELASPESLASLNEWDVLRPDGWPELLRHPRVVLLAEAGSGKSEEMQHQARQMVNQGQHAFYLDLVSLYDDKPTEIMLPKKVEAFQAWKADGTSTAWFFLDAVDELKLRQGKLEKALTRLAKETDGHLHRMHVVVSSRPSDWRPTFDMAIFKSKLPLVTFERSMAPAPTPEEAFLTALPDEGAPRRQEPEPEIVAVEPRTVILLPLSGKQIEAFARRRGIGDVSAFLAEIDRQDAWVFARRPLDLSDLARTWATLGTLGRRLDQHETNIAAKLRDDGERPDQNVLSDARAREGSERLALAVALTRARTIRLPEDRPGGEQFEGSLDPSVILPDWNEAERRTLLRRALFDPATYGRVRFHHRSVQEYLAACRLRGLCERGMPTRRLLRLLFTERYGVRLVRPSMQTVAAWLAVWNRYVRHELMEREPEILLLHGDPGSLPVDVRGALLRAFAAAYGDGGWRGLDVPLTEVRRLAHPELAEVVREIWASGGSNPDVRDLLLGIVWQGAISQCADIAKAAALNPALSWVQRVFAVRALLACGATQDLRDIAGAIVSGPEQWPDRFIHATVAELFPGVLTVDELVTLIERTPETREVMGGFAWAMQDIARVIAPWSEIGVQLRNALADLIRRGREPRQHWHDLNGRFNHVAPALALLCDRQILDAPGTRDASLCRACVIANRFDLDRVDVRYLSRDLKKRFEADAGLREEAFWAEVALVDELAPPEDEFERYFRARHEGLLEVPNEADRPWLEKALRDSADPSRRVVALHALMDLWRWRGRVETELDGLRVATGDDVGLTEILRLGTSSAPNPDAEKMKRDRQRRALVQEGRKQQYKAAWIEWREKLVADPETAFSSTTSFSTVSHLHKWLANNKRAEGRSNVWNIEALRQAFGEDVAKRAERAFREIWRANPPTLWSQRRREERNSTLWVWTYGLSGLAAEAEAPGWSTRLTPDEARVAAAYATLEINNFPAWLETLMASHPHEASEVIGGELSAELALGAESEFLSTLQYLARAGHAIKRLFFPQILDAARSRGWTAPGEPERAYWVQHLTAVMQILNDADPPQKAELAAECERRFLAAPDEAVAPVWLRQLFRFASGRAAEVFEEGLGNLPEAERPACAIRLFAGLFGNRESVILNFADDMSRAKALDRLVRCAYQYVRPENDRKHEGPYSPNTRDNAETARNFLLSALLDTSGQDAHRIVLALADNPMFAHFPDRLRLLARQRAANDAEAEPLDAHAVVALSRLYDVPPKDRDSLFEVMVDRLDDLQQEISHDDFTIRRTLRSIKEEAEMQRYLAGRLSDTAKSAYVVTREEEVADRKKPDIRLITNAGNHKAAIEVKIASSWTLSELERALRSQLVGQYLRDESCKVGCLLLTYEGTKTFWEHPETNMHMGFGEVIDHLSNIGAELERQSNGAFRLAVQGIDLRNPPLPAAHR